MSDRRVLFDIIQQTIFIAEAIAIAVVIFIIIIKIINTISIMMIMKMMRVVGHYG